MNTEAWGYKNSTNNMVRLPRMDGWVVYAKENPKRLVIKKQK